VKEWWLDTRYGCGMVKTDDANIVIGGAPIFKKLMGHDIIKVVQNGRYDLRRLPSGEPEKSDPGRT